MSVCCFCGHRQEWKINRQVRDDLCSYMTQLICEQEVDTFYSGGMGAFDALCEGVVRELKRTYPNLRLCLIIAEIELSALTIQCLLGERIPSIDALNDTLSAWNRNRNSTQKGVSWHFTTDTARSKLKHLYPEVKF